MKLSKLITVCSLSASLLTLSAKENTPLPTKFSQEYSVQGKTKGITEGGFYLNLITVIPSKKYINYVQSTSHTSIYGVGGGLEIGNYFRAADLDNIAIGVKATWLSVAYVPTNTSYSEFNTISGGVLHVGPYLGYALNEDMAAEAYYQAAPTINITFDGFGYTGITHKIGFTYRYKVFAAGLEYQTGKLKDIDYIFEDEEESDFDFDFDPRVFSNNLRINLGFKF